MKNIKSKINGLNAELLIGFLLKCQLRKIQIELRHSHGIDIGIFKDDLMLNIEVKSCQFEIKSIKTNNRQKRLGRFCLRPNDFHADLFCFVIPESRYLKFIESENLLHEILVQKSLIIKYNRNFYDKKTGKISSSLQFYNVKNNKFSIQIKLSQEFIKKLNGVLFNDIYKKYIQ